VREASGHSLSDLLVAADPDLSRLERALRTALTALGATLVLAFFSARLGWPATVPMVGAFVGMSASFVVNDPGLGARRVTMGLCAVVSLAGVALGTWLSPFVLASSVVFSAVVFGSVLAMRSGPRGMAAGLVGFMSYFSALFFRAPPAQLGVHLAGVAVAFALAYAIEFWVVRERPAVRLRRLERAFRFAAANAVRATAAGIQRGEHWFSRREERRLAELNDLALTIEEALERSGLAPEEAAAVRSRIFELEAGVGRLLAATLARTREDPQLVPSMLALLAEVRGALRRKDAAGLQTWLTRPGTGERLRVVLPDLIGAIEGRTRAVLELPPAGAPGAPPWRSRLRSAVQATIATSLALIAGRMISEARWYWAVIAAFVVYVRAATAGDALVRAWHRILGTVFGVLAGIAVAELVVGHSAVELGVVFLCVFLAYYAIVVSYPVFVGLITVMLACLYALLGRFTPGLLLLRLELTLVGAGIGALVARVVLPSHAFERTRHLGAEVLRGLASLCEAVIAPAGERDRRARSRALDAKRRELRQAARPYTDFFLGERSMLSKAMSITSVLVFLGRSLAQVRDLERVEPANLAVLREASGKVAANARALAAMLEGGEAGWTQTGPALTRATGQIGPRGDLPAQTAAHWLARIDRRLDELHALLGPPSRVDSRPRAFVEERAR
jgi:uncharacterized membrane protein YccC